MARETKSRALYLSAEFREFGDERAGYHGAVLPERAGRVTLVRHRKACHSSLNQQRPFVRHVPSGPAPTHCTDGAGLPGPNGQKWII
jgi:hypothetical protein